LARHETVGDAGDYRRCGSHSDRTRARSRARPDDIQAAQFKVEIDAAEYSADAESVQLCSNNQVARAKISEASLDRPLTDVVRIECAHTDYHNIELIADPPDKSTAHQRMGQKIPDWLPTPEIKLTFADGRSVMLPGQYGPYDRDQRERWDKFIKKVYELTLVTKFLCG
jgi:hypothetical protein